MVLSLPSIVEVAEYLLSTGILHMEFVYKKSEFREK